MRASKLSERRLPEDTDFGVILLVMLGVPGQPVL